MAEALLHPALGQYRDARSAEAKVPGELLALVNDHLGEPDPEPMDAEDAATTAMAPAATAAATAASSNSSPLEITEDALRALILEEVDAHRRTNG